MDKTLRMPLLLLFAFAVALAGCARDSGRVLALYISAPTSFPADWKAQGPFSPLPIPSQ